MIAAGPFYAATTLRMFNPPQQKVETLKAEDSALPPPLSEEESYVKKGDRVIQLLRVDS